MSHWKAFRPSGGDVCFGWYPDNDSRYAWTFQYQAGWHINIDWLWRGRDHRLVLVTNMDFDRDMRNGKLRPTRGFTVLSPLPDRRLYLD